MQLSLLDGDPHNSLIVVSLVATMYNIAKGFFGGYLGTLRWPKRIRPHHFAIPFNYFVFIMWLKPMEFCLVTKMCSCFKKLSMFSFPQREKEYRDSSVNTVSINTVLDLTRFFFWILTRFPRFNTEIFGTPANFG